MSELDELLPDEELTPPRYAKRMRKSLCVRGHPMFGSNLLVTGSGETLRRKCAICDQASQKRYRERTRASVRGSAIALIRDLVAEADDYENLLVRGQAILEAVAKQKPPGRKAKEIDQHNFRARKVK